MISHGSLEQRIAAMEQAERQRRDKYSRHQQRSHYRGYSALLSAFA